MIRFDSDLNKEINRVVSRFNAKVNKLMAKNATHLPRLVDESVLKAKYVDRNLLLRELKQLESFTRPGAEEIITSPSGIRMSKWEWNKLEQDRIYALKNVTRSLNKTKLDTDISHTLRSQQHFLRNQAVRSKMAQKTKDRQQAERDIRSLRSITSSRLLRHVTEYNFKENLLKMITNGFSEAGMDSEVIDRIKESLDTLSPEQLARAYHENINLRNFIEGYNVLQQSQYSESNGVTATSNIQMMNEIGKQFEQNIDKIVEEIRNEENTVDKPINYTDYFEF